jgi:hypothetical protein
MKKYTNASFKGTYGFSIFFGAKVVTGVGVATPDGKGNITGQQTLNLSGTVIPHTFFGTYIINPDGTGSASLTFVIPDGSRQQANFDYVVLEADETKSGMLIRQLQGFSIQPGLGGTLGFIRYQRIPS